MQRICFSILFLLLALPALGEPLLTEVVNLRAENNIILIDVARKYPQVKFSRFYNPNKVLIELLDSNYHKSFSFDDRVKNNLLAGTSFVDNVSVGVAKYGVDKHKVSVILTLGEDVLLDPKVTSTKGNVVKISLLPMDGMKKHAEDLHLVDSNIVQLYNSAVEEHTKGNLDQAEILYKDILSRNKNFYLASFNLAKIYLDKELYDESISTLQDLIQGLSKDTTEDKTLTYVQNVLGVAYYLKGNFNEAQECFRQVLEQDPTYYDAYYNIGLIYEKMKNIKDAKINFQKAIELGSSKSNLADAYYHLGVLNLITKNKKNAASGFKKVLELAPTGKLAELSQKELENIEKKPHRLFFR